MTAVAVVVGNYEGADLLPDCLDSLAAQTLAPAEVIVCDAGSTDASVEVARERGARVLELENRGLGHLYNRGVEAARADYVFVANNDLALAPDCLERLAEALDAVPSRFAADPLQLDWSGETVIHRRNVLRRSGRLLRTPLPGLELDPLGAADDVVPVVCTNAGAMLVRREQYLALGGFDETFFLDYEDLDLCWRAWARGWESVFVPAARLRHKVGMSASPTVSPRRLRSSHHNLLRFALKCLPPRAAATVVAGELLRLPRVRGPIASAFGQVARELPEIAAERRRLRPPRDLLDRLLRLA